MFNSPDKTCTLFSCPSTWLLMACVIFWLKCMHEQALVLLSSCGRALHQTNHYHIIQNSCGCNGLFMPQCHLENACVVAVIVKCHHMFVCGLHPSTTCSKMPHVFLSVNLKCMTWTSTCHPGECSLHPCLSQ